MVLATRAAYLNRIRRAFLLRVHPDRFRTQSAQIQQGQAQLVQALSNRLDQVDVQQWTTMAATTTTTTSPNWIQHPRESSAAAKNSYPYVMEQRDGSLFQGQLLLTNQRSVPDILQDMIQALQRCGATLPPPPASPTVGSSIPTEPNNNNNNSTSSSSSNHPHENNKQTATPHDGSAFIDRYNIVSNQGRDLGHFVQRLVMPVDGTTHSSSSNKTIPNNGCLWDQVRSRRMARTHAQAAALQVRRLYQFQAVDAVSLLGWSSSTVTMLLKRLLELHHEHGGGGSTGSSHSCHDHQEQKQPEGQPEPRPRKLLMPSFYPLRLVFSPSCNVAVETTTNSISSTPSHPDSGTTRHTATNTASDSSKPRPQTESSFSSSLDIFGGILYLHPSSTTLQWLDILNHAVTPERLQQVVEHKRQLEGYQRDLLQHCNWKVVKGFTCTSADYFHVVQHLWRESIQRPRPEQEHSQVEDGSPKDASTPTSATGTPAPQSSSSCSFSSRSLWVPQDPLEIKVEASNALSRTTPQPTREAFSQAQRFVTVTREGTLVVSSHSLKTTHLVEWLVRLAPTARERQTRYQAQKDKYRIVAQDIQSQLGLSRPVHATGVVTLDDYWASLQRLQTHLSSSSSSSSSPTTPTTAWTWQQILQQGLAGNALSITGSGHFCHLGDDGSVIIPHDWK